MALSRYALSVRRPARGWLCIWLVLPLLVLTCVAASATAMPRPGPGADKPPEMSHCPKGMSHDSGDHFVVFACDDGPGAAIDEAAALRLTDSLYAPMVRFMGAPPLDNYSGTGHAKDKTAKTDIYLVTNDQDLTREGTTTTLFAHVVTCTLLVGDPGGASVPDPQTRQGTDGTAASGWIVLSRVLLDKCANVFTSTFAHEFFHVLSFRYNTARWCPGFWFSEASAKWAEWYFVPGAAASWLTDEVQTFQRRPDVSLTDSMGRSAYSDFAWPLFMQQQKSAASIADAWKAMRDKTSCEDLNDAINAQVPFDKNFDAFAVENFDTELQNLATLKKGWPEHFGPTYQDLKPRAGSAPEFPQLQPKTGTTTVGNLPSAYPWHATTDVSLAPLSARYDKVEVLDPAESAEFDFSGLSNRGDLGITLIAADHGVNGSFVTVRVKGTGAKICFAADGAVDGTGTTLAGGLVYVILDDHSRDTAAKVTGSYTVTARTACAASVSGTVTVDAKTVDGDDTTVQTATLHMTLTPDPGGLWDIAPSSTYSATNKLTETDYCNGTLTETGQGSGTLMSWPDAYLDLGAYEIPYATPPLIAVPILSGASAPGTYSSPCGSGTQTVYLQMSPSCPPPSGTGQAVQYGLVGSYTEGKAALDFSCSDQYSSSGETFTNTVIGTLTATDPVPCGLWTPGCSIGTSAQPAQAVGPSNRKPTFSVT